MRPLGTALLTLLAVLLPAPGLTVSQGRIEFPANLSVHAAYYLWYGTPETDGRWQHWDHETLPHWDPAVAARYPANKRYDPPDHLHCPYYPLRGPYSSRDEGLVRVQLRELLEAGVGVVLASWWGPAWRPNSTDTQGVCTDRALPVLLRAAAAEGVQVAVHLEPYPGRSAHSVREDLRYFVDTYGASPALLRVAGRLVYYVYDSYHIAPEGWAALLRPGGEQSVRGTDLDGVFIGLWLNRGDGDLHILPGGFDGAYTYFASEAVSYAADPKSWPELRRWSDEHGKLFIASVGPGYDDTKIRPWNAAAMRPREGGSRYERWWKSALAARPDAVSITSYNEWGEGTQVEAARRSRTHDYQDYGVPALYMKLTERYVKWYMAQREGRPDPGAGPSDEL